MMLPYLGTRFHSGIRCRVGIRLPRSTSSVRLTSAKTITTFPRAQRRNNYHKLSNNVSHPPGGKKAEAFQRLRDFQLDERVFVVTGGSRGLGLAVAEALVEAGGYVHCIDRTSEPSQDFKDAQNRLANAHERNLLQYHCMDVQRAAELDTLIGDIAAEYGRLDGLFAAAGIQNPVPALDYPSDKISEMMDVNFGGVFHSAVSCARQMIKYKTPGSIVLVGSTSGLNAIKGFQSSVYSSSKGAVIQLGRSLAMEWGKIIDGKPIRVNVLCPGNILSPMVEEDFKQDPSLRATWERENMMGRLSKPREYRGAAIFMLSDASSFMTGSHVVIDGGYTAW